MSKHDLFVIVGKQTVIINNYKELLEDIKMGIISDDRLNDRIDEANKLAVELKDY